MPDPGAPSPPPSHEAVTVRPVPPLRLRLLAGLALLALLVLGSAVGLGAARWAGHAAAPGAAALLSTSSAPAAAPTTSAAAAPAAPAVGPAVQPVTGLAGAAGGGRATPADALPRSAPTSAPEARRSLEQLDARGLLRGGQTANDWRLARLQGNPQVLVLEFPGLAEQGAAMNRAAAFVEKDGAPRDRVLDDRELERLIRRHGDNPQTFFQGHDYTAQDLARFFTAARRQALPLNAQERRLLDLLLDQRVIAAKGSRYEALGLQAIVSFTGTQADDPRTPQDETVDERRRESVLLHELSHGLYFTSAAYREHCRRFWRERMSADERAAFSRLLTRMNYDPRNEDLLINEMQALLMHTPDTRAFTSESLGLSEAQLARLRTRFAEGLPVR
jgi:hypothetical protein